jgi:ferredoxin
MTERYPTPRPPLRGRTDATVLPGLPWAVRPPIPAPAPVPEPEGPKLRVDWPNCKAHGLCHELLPEAVHLDEWGYPVVSGQPLPYHLIEVARRAVASCPTLALRLVDPPR